MINRYIAGGVGGFVFSLVGFMVAAIITDISAVRFLCFFCCWAASVLVAVRSPSAPKAWESLLYATGILLFLLPILGGVTLSLDYVHPEAGSGAAALLYFLMVLGLLGILGGGVFWALGSSAGRDKKL